MLPSCRLPRSSAPRGFSLVEMLIALTVLSIVIAAVSALMVNAMLSRYASANRFESLQASRLALDMLAEDLRAAGYGADQSIPNDAQPAIAYADSMQIVLCENLQPYPDDPASHTAPFAYDPASNPRPRPLVASAWTPARQYSGGAELVHWTLDLNGDGSVGPDDRLTPEGADARRSRNPNDYTLVRRVYGELTGTSPGDNGGVTEPAALVLRPGGPVLPLFNIYLRGRSAPWNWSLGPVPRDSLPFVDRVDVNITAWSSRPDSRNRYSTTQLQTSVSSFRNAPEAGNNTYRIDGYVYADANRDGVKSGSEPGLSGATVRLGAGRVTYTSPTGYYAFRVPVGTYPLRHTAPSGYGPFGRDSVALTLGPASSFSFGDTARTGGNITVTTWDDADSDGIHDAGETGLSAITVAIAPGGLGGSTDASGSLVQFVAPGTFSVSVAAPSGRVVSTANPVSVAMTNGGTQSASFGLRSATTGTLTGKVYLDADRNGVRSVSESGLSGVSVWVTTDGYTALASGSTDASGNFSITVSANSTGAAYLVVVTTPSGYTSTSAASYSGVRVLPAATTSGLDFGVAAWNTKSVNITAGLPVFIEAVDMVEGDANTITPPTRRDIDLLLGVEAGNGLADIHTYSNIWSGSGDPFLGSQTYTDDVDSKLRSIAAAKLDTIDLRTTLNSSRPDLVLAFRKDAGQDFNLAIIPSWGSNADFPDKQDAVMYKTLDAGYAQAVVTLDTYGNARPDVVVGTRSAAGAGSIEIWENTSAGSSVALTRRETYTTPGNGFTQRLGEVQDMVLADMDGDGLRDLVVAVRTGTYKGEVLVFRFTGKSGTSRLSAMTTLALATDVPTSLAINDVDGDGKPDLVVGTQDGAYSGKLWVYRNAYATRAWSFTLRQTIAAPGWVRCLASGDFSGSSTSAEILVGYQSNGSYGGGLSMYPMVSGYLSSTPQTPVAGVTNVVTDIAQGDFNYARINGANTPASGDCARREN